MEVPTGVEVAYTQNGVRIALDGAHRGLFVGWAVGLVVATVAWLNFVQPEVTVFTILAWGAMLGGITMIWPQAHSVIELEPQAVRVFRSGKWTRIPWTAIERATFAEDLIVVFELADRTIRVPSGASVDAGRWVVERVSALSERARQDKGAIPRELLELKRSATALRA